MRDAAALVQRYFSAAEIAAWEALPQEPREQAFFNLWTRKEAYVKALGRGLSLPLHSFDVSHENGSAARVCCAVPNLPAMLERGVSRHRNRREGFAGSSAASRNFDCLTTPLKPRTAVPTSG
ncbi:MAG: 4'-phosphopantetheinyl transferase superfamily protein [Pseudomonadota bacterium]